MDAIVPLNRNWLKADKWMQFNLKQIKLAHVFDQEIAL